MQKQHNSTKLQDQHLEGKNLKPQLPHQQPSQHDIFPPTSMCGEKRRWKGEGGGNILAWEKSFFEKKVKKSKCSLVKKTAIPENTAKKLRLQKWHQENFRWMSSSTLTSWMFEVLRLHQPTTFKNCTLESKLGKRSQGKNRTDVTKNDGRNRKNTAYSFSHLKTAAGIK